MKELILKRVVQVVWGLLTVLGTSVASAKEVPANQQHDIMIIRHYRVYTAWLSGGPFMFNGDSGPEPMPRELEAEDGPRLNQMRSAYYAGYVDGVAQAKKIPTCAPIGNRDVYFNAMFSDAMSGALSTAYQKSPDWLHSVGFSYLPEPTLQRLVPNLDHAKIAEGRDTYPLDQVRAVGEMAGMVATRPCATDEELKVLAGPKLLHLDHRSWPHIG
jgi:hypothetical protein